MQKFWVHFNGEAKGPYAIDEIDDFIRQGLVKPTTPLLVDGTEEWVVAAQIPGIAAHFQPSSTTPSADNLAAPASGSSNAKSRTGKLVGCLVLSLGAAGLIAVAAFFLPGLLFSSELIADVVLREGLPSEVKSLAVMHSNRDSDGAASVQGLWASALAPFCGGDDIGKRLIAAQGKEPQTLEATGVFDMLRGEGARGGLQCGQRLSNAMRSFRMVVLVFEDGDQARTIVLMELGDLEDPPFALSHNFSGLDGRCVPAEEGSTECAEGQPALVRRGDWWAFGDDPLAVGAYAREWNRGDERSETTNMEYARMLGEQLDADAHMTAVEIRPEHLPMALFCQNLPGGMADCLPDDLADATTRILSNIRGVSVQALVPNQHDFDPEVRWTMSFATRDEDDAEEVARDLDELLRDWRAHLENREAAFVEQNRQSGRDDLDKREVMLRVFLRAMSEAEVETDGRIARIVAEGELSDAEEREVRAYLETQREIREAASSVVEAVIAGSEPERTDLNRLVGEDAASWMLEPRATEQTCDRIRAHIDELADGGVATADFGQLFRIRQRYVESPCVGAVMPGALSVCLSNAASIGQMASCPEPTPPWMGEAAVTAAGSSNFGTITLAAGFTPDPNVSTGTSGAGANGRNASTLDSNCNGQIDRTPDHLLVATTRMSNLRIMANSGSDTTLVIRQPDGSYACNDDGEGLNPVVVISGAEAGTYEIFVGSYDEGENATYKLGISELNSVTPSHYNLAL